MKNLNLTSFFFILFFSTIQSQATLEWEARYNGPTANDRGNKVVVDDDGNVYVTGKSDGTSASDYLTIKYNANGDTLWTARYNGIADGNDEALALIIDKNGNVYVTGKSMGTNTGFDIVTVKYNSNGVQQWENVFNEGSNQDDIPKDIAIDVFSNVYVCGSVSSIGGGVVIKYSTMGIRNWYKYQNNSLSTNIVKVNHLGNVVCASGLYYTSTFYPIYELNSSNGETVFAYNDDFNSDKSPGYPESMVLDNVGNIFVLSSNQSNSFSSNLPDRVFATKFTRGFDERSFFRSWSVNSSSSIRGVELKIDKNSNLYLLADFYSSFHRYFINKINASGNSEWDKTYKSGTNIDDIPITFSLSSLTDNPDIYTTGYTSTGNIVIVKYSNSGDSLWTKTYDCGNNGSDIAAAMVMDKCDNIYITGYSACTNTFQDIKSLKYSTAKLPIITQTGTNPICEGTSIMLATSTCTGCSYLWSTGETTSSISVSPIIETDYTVSVKYPSECELTSLPKKIMVNPLLTPGVSINASSLSICKGQNVIFTANPVNGGVNPSFQWYLNSVLQNGNTSTFSIATLNDGDVVSSTMTSNANCLATNMAVSNSVTMTVYALLPTGISIISSDNTICQGESVTFLATPLNGGTSPAYQWFVDGVLQPNQSGSSFATTLNQSATIYSTMTSNAVCPDPSIVSSESIFITVKPNLTPQITISASLNEICEGQNITFTASEIHGGSAPTYQWYINGVLQPNQNATFSGSNFIDGSQISCKMTSSELCSTAPSVTSNTISITVHPILNPAFEISPSQASICAGKNVTFTATPVNEGNSPNYQWYVNNVLQNGSGSTYTTTNLTNGALVSCIMTSNATCISQPMAISNIIAIVVNPSPVVLITPSGPTSFCDGNSVSLFANDAASYLWNDGQTTQSIIAINSGNHSVIITDNNGCTATSSTTSVIEYPLPSDTITKSGPTEFCQGGSISLTAALAQSYLWSTGETTQSINKSSTGVFNVTVTDINGCFAISLPTTIIVNPLPVAMIVPDGPTTFCLGENVILTASEAQSYVWNSGQTTRSVDITSPGVNVVTVTDANGCSAISSDMLVTVNPLITPAVTILSSANAICAGDNVTFTSTATNSGSLPTFQWYVNGNLQAENGPVFSTGTLTNNEQVLCRMTSNAECLTQPLVQSNIISIAVNPLLTPEVSISTPAISVLACQEVTFTPTPTNGGISPSYQWFLNGNSVSSTPSFSTSDLINGDQVSCIMTSSATCKSTPTATSNTLIMSVSQLPQPTITISEDTISSVNYKDALFGYIWYFNGSAVSSSPSIICSQYGNGSYYLVINYNGCTVTSNAKDIVCTVPTKDLDNKNSFIVYPNPTNNIIHISGINISSGEFRIEAYNVLGQKLEEKRILSSNDILDYYLDMSSYASGIYTITLYGETSRQVFKVHKIE